MKCSIRSLLLVAFAIPLTPSYAQADPIEDLVAAELARSNTPGIAIAIIKGGTVTRVQGFGEANIEHGVRVHADTLFKTGATGTLITAAAIMLLVEEGKLELDAPVSRYLPGTPEKWREVTIRHLLEHTSGIPATPNGDFRADYTNGELLAIIAKQDVNFAPGSRYRFSYAGYIVLGMVIQEVTGEHWSQFVQHRLFAPLGMRTARGIDDMAIVPNRAAGYEVRDNELRNAEWISPTANSTADGSLYMSALDFAAWGVAMSRQTALSAASWARLARPITAAGGATCPAVTGWFTDGEGANRFLWQSGSWQGFQTYALRYPDRDLTVAVFANGENANVKAIARRAAALAEPAIGSVVASPAGDADPAETARARALTEAIATGNAKANTFGGYAALDFSELMTMHAAVLGGLGPLQQFALFDRRIGCGETLYRYRAQYRSGMVEVRLGRDGEGRVSSLDIVPLRDWTEPL